MNELEKFEKQAKAFEKAELERLADVKAAVERRKWERWRAHWFGFSRFCDLLHIGPAAYVDSPW